MKRWFLISIAVIALAAVIWLLRTKGERRELPNLLLITMDTTRADHLGCYGYAAARTPSLDELAESGVRFSRFFCNVPLTLPSHATMMTGLYPPEHGCRVNGAHVLSEEIPTLAEVFSSHGYQTAAFVAAFVLDSKFGLDRGFRIYDDYEVPTSDDIYDDNAMYRYRRGDKVAGAALRWLTKHSRRPFFCWVHFFDPHRPYYFPGPGLGDAYDHEITYMDRQIKRLINYLKEEDLLKKTIIIAVGDHGEGLGDHGEEEHGLLLYDPVIRVPFIVSGAARFPRGLEVTELMSTVDLFSTILDLFGWKLPEDSSGHSFAGTLLGESVPEKDVYIETEFPLTEYGWSPLRGMVTPEWKYILAPLKELYNLIDDPAELKNLARLQPEKMRELADRLAALEEEMVRREAPEVMLDETSRKTLESLGYLGGGGSRKTDTSSLRDSKDAIWMRREFIDAVEDYRKGKTAEAESKLRKLIRESPESYTFRYKLAKVLYDQGRFQEALEEFREMAKMAPDEYKTHYNLGKTLAKLGRHEEAIEEFRVALQLDPEQTPAFNNLGIALLKTGRLQEAMEAFRKSIELDDAQVDPHNNLGNSLLSMGHLAEAADEFRRSVEIDQDFFEGRYNLGLCLLRLGKNREAAREFREALRLRPDFAPARQRLTDALRKGGNK
ncbi:MAG: sulfatase-like hydrolase/transferase [Candidatus Euphemobacter frigidus]|nr:sulfatase-like hydrolase/transferase [Candidatus Euphemobacter frigidus]MDP8276556.1 sulfatase-like hydrolase/transferase [Candidatus Euphemobacter frigidus]